MQRNIAGTAGDFCASASLDSDPGSQGFSWVRNLMARGANWVVPLRYEYYDCDIESLSRDKAIDLVGQRGLSSPYPVTLITSRRRYACMRSWSHISDNKDNIVTLRYVKSGAFLLAQCGTTISVDAGQFVFSKSNIPFRWESLAGDTALSEYYSILLPLELVLRFFPHSVPLKDSMSAPLDRRLAMPAIFSLLVDQGQYLERHVVEMLVDTLLTEAKKVCEQEGIQVETRKQLCEKRFEDVVGYIALHLSNSDLCVSAVARACGISPRYVCHLLKSKGTSFSDLLWAQRLKHAGEWLVASDMGHFTIAEIAYMSGFKTAAHFSRLFKTYWGYTPREYRQSEGKSCIQLSKIEYVDPALNTAGLMGIAA